MSVFQLVIHSADEPYYDGACESVIVPTEDGLLGILAHHIPMVAGIVPGVLTMTLPGGEKKQVVVSEGMIKIHDNEVNVLVDALERPEDIDANRAKRAADEAKEQMLQKKSYAEFLEAEADLKRAINRMKASQHLR